MITSLHLGNFKNFADETLHLGPFSVIVGANASGKSNIRDALRFLHGIGRGYTLADIIGGRYGLGGNRVSAASASDGTMRCLIIMASLLQTKPGGIHVFEEIDNGIHPSRQHLLLDLIEGQVADDKMQVVTTTHSPPVLAMMNDDTFASSSVICRRSDAADAVIRRLTDLPDARKLRTSQGLGRLHASGWMEDMIELEDREGADEA